MAPRGFEPYSQFASRKKISFLVLLEANCSPTPKCLRFKNTFRKICAICDSINGPEGI